MGAVADMQDIFEADTLRNWACMVSLYAMKRNDNDFALNDNGCTGKMSLLAVIVFLLQSERNMKFVKHILAASHKKNLICMQIKLQGL